MTYIHLLSFASFSILLQQVPSLSQLCHSHGLALALATLFRYTGPRVSEVAAFQIPDVQVGARHGLRIIRRGKGLKHREIPLVQNRVNVHTQYSKISVSRRIGHEYPIGVMCRVLEVSVSGFSAWKPRPLWTRTRTLANVRRLVADDQPGGSKGLLPPPLGDDDTALVIVNALRWQDSQRPS